ncbi:unnamed protein product [Aspergillus oryzae]|nr:unnamed protein product [Aspergillus oryzae]
MHYLAYIRERDVDEVIGIQGHEYGSIKSHASTQGIQWRIASNPQPMAHEVPGTELNINTTSNDQSAEVGNAGGVASAGTVQAPVGTASVSRKRQGSPLEAENPWVIDIIREATSKQIHEELKASFLRGEPDMSAATVFFAEVNQKIQKANDEHGAERDRGTIPGDAYEKLYADFKTALEKAKLERNEEAALYVVQETHSKFAKFNQEHHLPEEWNINPDAFKHDSMPEVAPKPEPQDNDSLFSGSLPDYTGSERYSRQREHPRGVGKRGKVRGIVGVGWKVDDDDEEGIEPLDLLVPKPYATYPHTRILVLWVDGAVTLEDRAFIRRITKGSYLNVARIIYHKALRQEIRYRKAERLPYEHLLDRMPTRAKEKQDIELGDEEYEQDGEELNSVEEVQPEYRGSVQASTIRSASTRPPSNHGRSRTSEVRFVEPALEPRRPTSERGTARPSPNRVPHKSVDIEDPRDAKIRWLEEQLEMSLNRNHQSSYDSSSRWRRYNRYDGRQSEVSEYTPEPRRRRRAVHRERVWDNWTGSWVTARRVY